MRIPDANGEVVLFWGMLVKVVACGVRADELDTPASRITQRIEDESGHDIGGLVRGLDGVQAGRKNAAVLTLDRPGFDGPFCALPLDYWIRLS